MVHRGMFMDPETGEVFTNAKLITEEQLQAQREYCKKAHDIEVYKAATGLEQFVMYMFTNYQSMTDLKPQTAIRLTYLATYLEFDGEYIKENGNYIHRDMLQSLMALKPTTFKDFLKEVVDTGYLIKDKKNYRLNTNHFFKGHLQNVPVTDDKRFVRVYIDNLRKLYLTVPQSKHVYLGYIFQLVPYVNREWNIICHNPLETDKNEIKPMTIGDFAEKIGYERSNASRLINIYRDITFEWLGAQQQFCGYFWEPKKSDMMFFVNPNIFFAGNDFHKVEIFEIVFHKKKQDDTKNISNTEISEYDLY